MTAATAIVVTYNSAAHIGSALTALSAGALDVIVVDNASADGTASFVAREFPDVGLIRLSANAGFAKAVNIGLAGAAGEIVLLVNPDCTVPPDTVRGLVDYLASRPDVGLAGPRLVGVDGQIAISAHPFETLHSVVLSRFGGGIVPVAVRRAVSGPRRRRSYDACLGGGEPTSVDWLSGACLAVRADLLRRAGGLDERYFLYYEDEELAWQARRHGHQAIYLPGLVAVHVGGASSEVGATWPHLYRSMLIFFARHRGVSFQAVRITVLVRATVGILLGGARRALRRPGGATRTRAWVRVAVIAWTSSRHDLERAAA